MKNVMTFTFLDNSIPQLRGKSDDEKSQLYKEIFSRHPRLLWIRGILCILTFILFSILIRPASSLPYGWIIGLVAPILFYIFSYGYLVGPRVKDAFAKLEKSAEQGAAANP
jgi:hypothetical protein